MRTRVTNAKKTIDRIYGSDLVRDASFVMKDYHYHAYYELFYVMQGECRLFVGDTLYQLRPGHCIIIPPEFLHYTRYNGVCRRFSGYFMRSQLYDEVAEQIAFDERFVKPRLFTIPSAWQNDIVRIIERMDQEENTDDRMTAGMMKMLFGELLMECARYGAFEEELAEHIHSDDEGVVKAAHHITMHYDQKLTQATLAAISGYSPNYFSRRFKETTGIGAHEYLLLVRLKNAAALLRSSDESVLNIALSVGFTDANYFKDAFKKMYGVSPRAYRK